MSDRPSKHLPDLMQNWPDDPANEDLSRLGRDLFASRPELSQLALDRIQIRMRQAMNRPWWQRRWRTLLVSIIGAVALSVGVYGWIASAHRNPPRDNIAQHAQTPDVQDHYQVTLPGNSPKPPDKPLVDLQRYNDLFTSDGKEPKR